MNSFSVFFRKLNRRKKLSNKGATMMVAIVIMAILIIFTFALTLVAYTYYSSQNKNIASMRCAEAANTFSLALKDELTYVAKDDTGKVTRCPEYDSYLYKYLRYNLFQSESFWPYYTGTGNHDSDHAYRKFKLTYNSNKYDDVEGLPGKTEVTMYWVPENNTYDYSIDTREQRDGTLLYIIVTCESASQTYTVTSKYKLHATDIYKSEEEEKLDAIASPSSTIKKSINPLEGAPLGDCSPKGISEREKWVWEFIDME